MGIPSLVGVAALTVITVNLYLLADPYCCLVVEERGDIGCRYYER